MRNVLLHTSIVLYSAVLLCSEVLAQTAGEILDKNKAALVSVFSYELVNYNYKSEMYSFDTLVLGGSGFIMSEDGLVGTCLHVVKDLDSIMIRTLDSVVYGAEVLYADNDNDLAILRVIGPDSVKFRTVKFGDSDKLRSGEPVFAVGNPMGYEYSISQGIISGIRFNEFTKFYGTEVHRFNKVIQTDAALSPGNSGGALFNESGEVIGVTSYGYGTAGNLYFAVSINSMKKLADPDSSTIYRYEKDGTDQFLDYKLFTMIMGAKQLKGVIRIKSGAKPSISRSASKEADEDEPEIQTECDMDSVNTACFNKAESLYNKCIQLDSEYTYAYEDLIDLYLKRNDTGKAASVYNSAYRIFGWQSSFEYVMQTMESYYAGLHDYQRVMKLYQMMDSNNSDSHYKLGKIYLKINKPKKAIKEFENAVRLSPENYKAYFQLAKIYLQRNDFPKAKKYFKLSYLSSIENDINDPRKSREIRREDFSQFELNYDLGIIYLQEGKKLTAMMHYMKMEPSDAKETEKKLELYKKIAEME